MQTYKDARWQLSLLLHFTTISYDNVTTVLGRVAAVDLDLMLLTGWQAVV